MAKVILICGKICCGKTTYSQKICKEDNAVLLSVDEITLDVLGGNLGENHDEYVKKVKLFLLKKSVEIVKSGTSVVLDWGFWTKPNGKIQKHFILITELKRKCTILI